MSDPAKVLGARVVEYSVQMPGEAGKTAVVIPARNAAPTLPATLAALSRQDFGDDFEVVVVDDGSTDATARIARDHGARVVETEGAGPAEARNAGARATDAALLAFTDADCVPEPSWLRIGVQGLRAGASLVRGPILPARPPGGFDKTIHVAAPSVLFESANLFVSRDAFEAAGGFERPAFLPESVPHFGEDVLFGWRVMRNGATAVFSDDAVVLHEVFTRGPRGYVTERLRLRFFPPLVREAKELREAMPLRLFLSERTARADLAFAAALIALRRRSLLPLIGALPYARRELAFPPPWRPGFARYNAAQVAADLTGLAALAWGSIRHRSPVL